MTEALNDENKDNYARAREHLQDIIQYLEKIDEFGYYELSLVTNCLFMFEIDVALSFGERALKLIEKNYPFYKNKHDSCVLLNNMAIYALNYPEYYHYALKYAQLSDSLATKLHDATRAYYAKITYQIACFKSGNGLYNKAYLQSLLDAFKILEWNSEYHKVKSFIQRHGISLSS